jgi:hypothetical protein
MVRRRELIGYALLAIISWPFALWGADTESQRPKTPIAHLEVAAGHVEWLPQVEYERLILTVAGPGGFFVRQELKPGKTPSLNVLDAKGGHLPDGSYAYELSSIPRSEKALQAEGGPLVQSGFLSVRDGSFVDLSSQPAPKPPANNLPTKDITQNDDLIVQGQDGPVLTLKGNVSTLLQIKFDNTDCCFPSTRDWALQANDLPNVTGNFLIRDLSTGTVPVRIGDGVPDNTLVLQPATPTIGNVGLGTLTPATQLHVRGNDAGFRNKILVENVGSQAAREMLEIRNNGGSVFILEDTSVPQRWAEGTVGANLVLDEQAHAGIEYTFSNTGNLTIAGVLTQGSSRDLKTGFAALDPKDVLARVSALPVSLWSYKTETAVRHAGPMAEDFHQAFGLGEDDKHIAPGDQAGVALLAVQGLNQVVQDKAQEIATLRRENTDLAKRVEALEALLSKLTATGAAAPAEQMP